MAELALARAAFLVAAVAAFGLYGSVVAGVARQWVTDPVSSHGILLAAGAAFVVYRRWRQLHAIPIEPRNWGLALFATGLLVYVVGALAGDVFLLRISLPLAIIGVVVGLFGVRHLRVAAAPLALVILAIPLPGAIVTHLTMPLQLVASQVAAAVLQTVQIDVVRQGNLLVLDNITLEVADVCSGLRSVVSLNAIAALCGVLLSLRPQRTLMLMAAALPIAVVGNGFRVAATGVLTTWFGEVAVRGTLHELTGVVSFLVMCAAVIGLQIATRRPLRIRRATASPAVTTP
jgi:exosortase